MTLTSKNQSAYEIKQILLVEDDLAQQNTLIVLLKIHGYEVNTFVTAEELFAFLSKNSDQLSPTVCILMDLHLPEMSGIEAQRQLKESFQIPIIFISGRADKQSIINTWRDGAMNFLLKPFDTHELLSALDDVFNSFYISISKLNLPNETIDKVKRLTPREREILPLLAKGYTNNDIKDLLKISTRTVKMHRSNLSRKVGSEHITDLVRFYECSKNLF